MNISEAIIISATRQSTSFPGLGRELHRADNPRKLINLFLEHLIINFLKPFQVRIKSLVLAALNGHTGLFLPLAELLQDRQIIFLHRSLDIFPAQDLLLDHAFVGGRLIFYYVRVAVVTDIDCSLELFLFLIQDVTELDETFADGVLFFL